MTRFIISLLLAFVLATPAHAAVTRLELPGAWYTENLPGGEYASLFAGSHIITHAGNVDLPPQEVLALGLGPLYLRVTNVGGFQFAGQSHAFGTTWHWTYGQGWTHVPQVAHGVSGAIFDLLGHLRLSDPSFGSQGFRFVDASNRIWTGDETYGHPTLRLSEWTQHGDVTIGQGWTHVGGAVAVHGGRRVVLEGGHTTFIRFNRQGNRLAVAVVKALEAKAVLLWMDVADLASFPLEPDPVHPDPQPDPDPEPDPEPEPEPEPEPQLEAPDVFSVVQALAAQFPHLLNVNTIPTATEFTQRVVLELCANDFISRCKWGHVGKTHGEGQGVPNGFAPRTVDGHHVTGVSYDVIWHRPSNRQVDILGNATANEPGPWPKGPARVQWDLIDREFYRSNNPWIPGIPVNGENPPPPPPPPPPTCGYPDVRAELDFCQHTRTQLDALVTELQQLVDREWSRADQMERERNEAIAALDAEKSKPQPTCSARIFGIRVPCTVTYP